MERGRKCRQAEAREEDKVVVGRMELDVGREEVAG
jgi:hypothetical protein